MSSSPARPTAYYEPIDDGRFRSTTHAQGAWSADQQHMAPVSGLLTHVLETCSPRDDLIMSRVAFDILGSIPDGEVEVAATVVRAGRTIELLEAEMTAGGRAVVRATAWRLARSDTSSIAGTEIDRIPGPDELEPFDMAALWPGGYIRSVEVRAADERRPGRATVWIRPKFDLIDGVEASDTARLFGVIDTANGVAVRARPDQVLFPNTDLTVHLFRRPEGEWLGLDTDVTFGPDGLGLTSSVLHDVRGPVGRSAQTLTVRILG
ncbi:Thioesterase-like superfamily protein [Nakamurella panacisegetis]|uniref:Thioesterase-like superfamily protein n=1 Tax=Nakamurella panacisegetis TaxID=1090615 RepID=A0A1H0RR67_9ACTN|nr:thioesterase family protein [Nakamurella panacisegetis]SDP31957.1 Thioesterase-like superfamily protein [Nakamurella panacisegetis]